MRLRTHEQLQQGDPSWGLVELFNYFEFTLLNDPKELIRFFNGYLFSTEVSFLLSESPGWDILIQSGAYFVGLFRAYLRFSLGVLRSHQQVRCREDTPTTCHTAYAGDVSNFGRAQVTLDGPVLLFIWLLRGVPPWDRLVAFVRE